MDRADIIRGNREAVESSTNTLENYLFETNLLLREILKRLGGSVPEFETPSQKRNRRESESREERRLMDGSYKDMCKNQPHFGKCQESAFDPSPIFPEGCNDCFVKERLTGDNYEKSKS
jgi:hypothetical protein